MGMVAMLWFFNFSGIFLPSLRLDLSGLGVGMPSQGPELSLDWLDPLSFLPCFSAFGLTSSSWLLGFPAPIFFRCAWQVFSFFLFWFALPFNLRDSFLGSCFRCGGLPWVGFFFHVGVGSWSFFLNPSLKVVVFSLSSGRVHSTVFLEPFAFLFLYLLRSFRQLLGVIPFG